MAERFYLNCLLAPGPVDLAGPEAHHLATVCRLRPGDAVCLFNGDGHEYAGHVLSVERRHVTIEVLERRSPIRELPFHLEIAAPLPKGDRAPFLIEKLTELGVTRFVPLSTRRSVVHPRESKLDRLERQVIEASKQCGRNVLMEIGPLTSWEAYCQAKDLPAARWLAHPAAPEDCLIRAVQNSLTCAVGPEGGFTEEEIAVAQSASWRLVGLGARILRMETAAIVLAASARGEE